jgi:hypothetical protein
MFFQFMPNWNEHNKNECGDNNIMIVTHKVSDHHLRQQGQ